MSFVETQATDIQKRGMDDAVITQCFLSFAYLSFTNGTLAILFGETRSLWKCKTLGSSPILT